MTDSRRYTLQQLFRNYKESHQITGLEMPVLAENASDLNEEDKKLIAELALEYDITKICFNDAQMVVCEEVAELG